MKTYHEEVRGGKQFNQMENRNSQRAKLLKLALWLFFKVVPTAFQLVVEWGS